MDRNVMIERLEWLASATFGSLEPEWLAPNMWAQAIAELATAALEEIKEIDQLFDLRHSADMLAIARWRKAAPGRELKQPDHTDLCVWLLDQHRAIEWRPIAEAPIPSPEGLRDLWTFSCLLQDGRGVVGEGIARYVKDGRVRGNKSVKQLRWYFGDEAGRNLSAAAGRHQRRVDDRPCPLLHPGETIPCSVKPAQPAGRTAVNSRESATTPGMSISPS